jgi:MFS family permease
MFLMNPAASPAQSRFKNFLHKFLVLRGAPRELWVIYGAYVLENVAYKVGAASVLTLWLSSDLGFGDTSAGAIISTWSAILTLITVVTGSLVDALGIRRTFLLGFSICLVSRTVMTLTADRWIVLPFGLYLQAAGIALMTPVMVAACKRYSNAAQRSMVFALFYVLMNFGYAIGDLIFDKLRGKTGLGETGTWILPWLGTELSTYRVLISLSVVFTVPGLILVRFFLRDGVEMTEEGVTITRREPSGINSAATLLKSVRETGAKTWKIFSSLWRQVPFYRFLMFMSLVVGVRMIYYNILFMFPKYGIRVLGPSAQIGQLSGVLNEVLIIVLVPICAALTQKVTAYRMVTAGSLVSALSVFFIALPPEWFKPLAAGWLGNLIAHQWLGASGAVNPLYISIAFFIILYSVGEALWSPRLYEYAAACAPKGQEASYMALSMLPMFAAKFLVGGSSGWLLAKFCPAEGPRTPEVMWLIVGCMALVTPLGTFLFRKYLQLHEEGR